MDPIKTFIRQPIFTAMLVLAVVVFGLFAYPKIGVDQFPDVDFPVVTVTTILPGADPETIERNVSRSARGGAQHAQRRGDAALDQRGERVADRRPVLAEQERGRGGAGRARPRAGHPVQAARRDRDAGGGEVRHRRGAHPHAVAERPAAHPGAHPAGRGRGEAGAPAQAGRGRHRRGGRPGAGDPGGGGPGPAAQLRRGHLAT